MNTALLWIVTLLYAGQGALWLRNGLYADALILGGYVVANVGLIVKVTS
ncbi:MAG: hypothetical protein AB7U62_18375 [Pseudolabrys sp.]